MGNIQLKYITLLLECTLFCNYCLSQINTYEFEQMDSIQKTDKRNVVVFIYTSWCTYCKAMKNTTLKNKTVTQLLNENFYFVLLNAEEKRNIVFEGNTFRYKPTGINTGIHELATHLGTIGNEIAYPTIVFLNTKNKILYQYNGYLSSNLMIKILKDMKGY